MDSVILGTFAGCIVGGIFPWINTEVIVAGSVLLAAPHDIGWLVVAAAAGHTLAKTGVYALARWAPHLLPSRAKGLLARGQRLSDRAWMVPLTLLASSSAGLPPFFVTTIAAGMLRVPLVVFASAGMAGTSLRYAALAYGATLVTGGLDLGLT